MKLFCLKTFALTLAMLPLSVGAAFANQTNLPRLKRHDTQSQKNQPTKTIKTKEKDSKMIRCCINPTNAGSCFDYGGSSCPAGTIKAKT